MKIGCHVSNSGEMMLVGAIEEALSYKANCFMIYHGAPQNSYRKTIDAIRIPEYKKLLIENNIDPKDIIIHAAYILNLAQGDEEKRNYAVDFIVNEVERTEAMDAMYLVIHPGASLTLGVEVGLNNIIRSLKEVLEKTKGSNVVLTLETMAGKGTETCFEFSHLKYIMDNIDSPRIKVCLDTCHTSDSGYDWVNDYEGVIKELDTIIGIDNVKVIHVNDSLNITGARKDRHANIGLGTIGFDTLSKICHDERFKDIPKILETPYLPDENGKKIYPPYRQEIEMLKKNEFNDNLIEDIINNR